MTLLILETYSYEDWFKNEELADTTGKNDKQESVDLSDMPHLGGDGEVKEGKENINFKQIINLTFTFINTSKWMKQVKQIKNEIRQTLYLLYQHINITKKFYNNLIKSLQWKKI